MSRIQAPRGTQDILPAEQPYWDLVRNTAATVASQYGFQRIDTPMFEDTGVFERGVGEGTDIVEKEMYTFEDKGGASLTLRAEGTAPVVRAYLEHGMFKLPQPVKLFYICPIFRFERPQAGRFRQHHQFGVEALGEMDPALDAEVIELLWTLYARLGLTGLSLQINSIGDSTCRPRYLEELRSFYRAHLNEVCDDDRIRFQKNPLRLLDCKVPSCQGIADKAPHSAEFLCDECRDHFAGLQRSLELRGLQAQVNFRLVRGLDYYTKTVFEIWPAHGGAQSTIGGGGRYDGLAEQLRGPHIPGVGFGAGLERLVLTLEEIGAVEAAEPPLDVLFAVLHEEARPRIYALMDDARASGLRSDAAYGGRRLRRALELAGRRGAARVVIVGEDEWGDGEAAVRDMTTGEQRRVALDDLVSELRP